MYEKLATPLNPKSLDDSICDALSGAKHAQCTGCFSMADSLLEKATKDCGSDDADCFETALNQHGMETLQCDRDLLVPANSWSPPGESDQRGPCPFINTLANHGVVNRNGQNIDLLDLAVRLEAVYNVHRDFLNGGPVQLAIDCNQTYTDAKGIIRIDLEALFQPECEEHEASMVRADRAYGFEASKLVNATLVDSLMAKNPDSKVLTKEDVMEYQVERIQNSGYNNEYTVFRPDFDYANMGAQGVFLFLVGSDPFLETVKKNVLEPFLLNERLPDNFLPGSLRDTPFNFLDEEDFSSARFEDSVQNVADAVLDYPEFILQT